MITADEIKVAAENVRWVMSNLPTEFALSDEMPVDRLMHALGVLEHLAGCPECGLPISECNARAIQREKERTVLNPKSSWYGKPWDDAPSSPGQSTPTP